MAYQSRKRNLKSRREKLEQTSRNLRIIFVFGAVILFGVIYKYRHKIWLWLDLNLF